MSIQPTNPCSSLSVGWSKHVLSSHTSIGHPAIKFGIYTTIVFGFPWNGMGGHHPLIPCILTMAKMDDSLMMLLLRWFILPPPNTISVSTSTSIYLSINQSIYLSIYLSTYLPTNLIYLSIYLSIYIFSPPAR